MRLSLLPPPLLLLLLLLVVVTHKVKGGGSFCNYDGEECAPLTCCFGYECRSGRCVKCTEVSELCFADNECCGTLRCVMDDDGVFGSCRN